MEPPVHLGGLGSTGNKYFLTQINQEVRFFLQKLCSGGKVLYHIQWYSGDKILWLSIQKHMRVIMLTLEFKRSITTLIKIGSWLRDIYLSITYGQYMQYLINHIADIFCVYDKPTQIALQQRQNVTNTLYINILEIKIK